MKGRLQSIPLEAIQTDPKLQNRNVGMQKFKEHSDAKRYKDHINQLFRSIKAVGLKEPLKVVAAEEGCGYELAPGADQSHPVPVRYWLVDGHHRLDALKKAGKSEALVEVLPGLGFADAQDASRLANQQIVQSLSLLERTENAWSAFNQERATYRKMGLKEATQALGVSKATIKRFRDAVRQEGVAAGKIDPNAPRDKVEQQLQSYWSLKRTWGRLSIITWRQYQLSRKEPSKRTSGAARKHLIKMAIVQLLFAEEGRFDPKDATEALEELGLEAGRPDASAYLEEKFKPKVSQPTAAYEDDLDDDVDYDGMNAEIAKMNQERYSTGPNESST